jgi:membrane-associated protease RseP (regulator of RpoE activity)
MSVVRGTGPAAAAGIQPGDTITKVDGRLVGSAAQFRGLVRQKVDSTIDAAGPGGYAAVNEVEVNVTVKPPSGPASTHIVVLGNTTGATYRSPTRSLHGSPAPRPVSAFR